MEVCNGIDDNCDGLTDPDNTSDCRVFYRDNDGDGYGDSSQSICACKSRSNYTSSKGGDCCDDDFRVFPGQQEFFSDASFCGGMTLTVIVGRTNRIPLLMAVVQLGRVVEPRSAGLPRLLRLAEVEQPMSLEGVAGGCLAATRPTRSKGVRLVGEVAGAGAGTGRDGDRGRDRGRDRNLALFICSPIL